MITQKYQRLFAFVVVLALLFAMASGATYRPLYAQAETGILYDLGEGANRILTSDWLTINPGQQITYQFNYDGDEQPVSVWMNVVPADGAIFQIWTDERLQARQGDPDTEPLGEGTAMTEGSGFTNWQGGSPEAETYYVVVSGTGESPARFLLNISSPALALEQPGAVAAEATEPQPTPPADPNIAIVTTTALNVRAGPSTAFAVLTTVPNGTQMTVLGRNATNTWINVRLEDGTEGWVTRSLTNYTAISPNVITPGLLPVAESAAATTTVTATVPVTASNNVTDAPVAPLAATPAITPTELGEGWQVLEEGEIDWYTFQYRGGDLPLTIWMDVEPFGGAEFTVVDAETAQGIVAGTVLTPTVIGRGMNNPVEPGYLFWQAEFLEADTFYVMVEATEEAEGDVLYSIHALGPGVGRVIEPVE